MNIHVPEKIKNKWKYRFEFRGKVRFIQKNEKGIFYIEAYDKELKKGMYYIFGADAFIDRAWMDTDLTELIFDDEDYYNS